MRDLRPKWIIWLLLAAVIAIIAFIWVNSLDSPELSSEKSEQVTAWLTPLLELIVGKDNVTEYLVRKIAHFGEFFLLSAALINLIVGRSRAFRDALIECLFLTLLIAMVDETIQLFSDRGSQLKDVWLDFAGGSTGALLTLLVRNAISTRKHRK